MRKLLIGTVALSALVVSGLAQANESVMKATSDAKNWAIQTGDYANHRYSTLDQINKDNVKDLQVSHGRSRRVFCVVTKVRRW
jgi:glucose dehydrogenase